MYSLQNFTYQIYKYVPQIILKNRKFRIFLFLYIELLLYVAKPIHRSDKKKIEKNFVPISLTQHR